MRIPHIVSASMVLVLFVGMSVVASIYSAELESFAGMQGTIGVVGYIGVTILATVAAPLSSLPLLPIAATMWSPMEAALLSIVGWVVGAVIAFYIARRYGRVVVLQFVSLANADSIADRVLGRRQVVSIILLRMILPVDVLSYALGLFGSVRWKAYVIGTTIGVIPFAFIFSYLSQERIIVQLSLIIAIAAVLGVLYRVLFRDKNSQSQ